MATWRQDFRNFILKGNVVELAIAVVLGIAFAALVSTVVSGLIMPLIAAVVGETSFDALIWTVNDSPVLYGTVITAAVDFLIIGAALFVGVKAYQRMQRPQEVDLTDAEETPADVELLQEIRDLLRAQRGQQIR